MDDIRIWSIVIYSIPFIDRFGVGAGRRHYLEFLRGVVRHESINFTVHQVVQLVSQTMISSVGCGTNILRV